MANAHTLHVHSGVSPHEQKENLGVSEESSALNEGKGSGRTVLKALQPGKGLKRLGPPKTTSPNFPFTM